MRLRHGYAAPLVPWATLPVVFPIFLATTFFAGSARGERLFYQTGVSSQKLPYDAPPPLACREEKKKEISLLSGYEGFAKRKQKSETESYRVLRESRRRLLPFWQTKNTLEQTRNMARSLSATSGLCWRWFRNARARISVVSTGLAGPPLETGAPLRSGAARRLYSSGYDEFLTRGTATPWCFTRNLRDRWGRRLNYGRGRSRFSFETPPIAEIYGCCGLADPTGALLTAILFSVLRFLPRIDASWCFARWTV